MKTDTTTRAWVMTLAKIDEDYTFGNGEELTVFIARDDWERRQVTVTVRNIDYTWRVTRGYSKLADELGGDIDAKERIIADAIMTLTGLTEQYLGEIPNTLANMADSRAYSVAVNLDAATIGVDAAQRVADVQRSQIETETEAETETETGSHSVKPLTEVRPAQEYKVVLTLPEYQTLTLTFYAQYVISCSDDDLREQIKAKVAALTRVVGDVVRAIRAYDIDGKLVLTKYADDELWYC